MTTIETKRHIEINEAYQGVNLSEFSFVADKQIDNDQIVYTFIRTRHFATRNYETENL